MVFMTRYEDYFPDFTYTSHGIEKKSEILKTLGQFDSRKELLGVKLDKKSDTKSLVRINKADLTIKNQFLSLFGVGKLAHIDTSLYKVCRHLWHYEFKSEQDEIRKKVCEVAGKLVAMPKINFYERAVNKYNQSPESLATLALWIKNSDREERALHEGVEGITFPVYTNPSLDDENLRNVKIELIFKKFFIWNQKL